MRRTIELFALFVTLCCVAHTGEGKLKRQAYRARINHDQRVNRPVSPDPEAAVRDLILEEHDSEGANYGHSSHSAFPKKKKGRGHRKKNKKRTSSSKVHMISSARMPEGSHQTPSTKSSSHPFLDPSYISKYGSGGNKDLFKWDKNIGTVITRKKTTKTTKISQTDGSAPDVTSYTYTYTYPGSKITTIRNTTTITSGGPLYSKKEYNWFNSSTGNYGSSLYGSSGSSGSHYGSAGSQYGSSGSKYGSGSVHYDSRGSQHGSSGSQYGSSGSQYGSSSSQNGGSTSYKFDQTNKRLGAGEEYLKRTEEGLSYDLEEGPVISKEDMDHPLVVKGFGQSGECTCNTKGTLNNAGCNFFTGECQCKRNVIGRDCNQCLSQHYGLSEIPEGCQPCTCDRGGAYSNDCDIISGQCRCRPHVTGRRCDKPEEGYFVPYLNYLTYEAELARGSELYCEEESLYQYRQAVGGNCQVVMREPYRDGRESTWTGIGFMRAFRGSHLEFEIENIETSMEYNLVIKYEPQFRGHSWDGVNVRIERPAPVDKTGPCGTVRTLDDNRYVDLSEYERDHTLIRPVCLEAGKRYKIILEFSRNNAPEDLPSASVLIDSISLIPRAEQLPIYTEYDDLKYEYQSYRCSEPFYTGQGIATLSERCIKDHLDSIGFYVFGQAYSCQCDMTGSKSSLCDPYGGQCDCKSNVKGRRCDRCAPGTYDFGPDGCVPCECNSRGALDNFCDQSTGKCKCRLNTYGRQCDECQPGYWNFPDCRRCVCNGHADICDARTGECISCRDFTSGPHCSVCEEGHYGDPRLESGIACRQCPCPGTIDSRHSFADRCRLDPNTKDVICECREGYAGSRCDVCADNYYGNPEVPSGQCQPCECSNNIDISRPGNCDSRTGECEKCLFNTDGFNCERCRAGYFGDALVQQCRECVCDILGTNNSSRACNHQTGQCHCLPNVKGKTCDKCTANHWKIGSGIGCEPCLCDTVGSYSEHCHESPYHSGSTRTSDYEGRCDCRPGFGGRKCDQCQTNFFGDPRHQCLPCECNLDGSDTLQCNHQTGQCQCLVEIGGFKCDQCARGYRGRGTSCKRCGECFDNWDRIISSLKARTNDLIARASTIKERGATGAYSYEFESMEEKIADVENTLLNANTSSQSLDELADVIKQLGGELTEKEKQIQSLEYNVDKTSQRISLASNTLEDLRIQADVLKIQVGDLEADATQLQEANVEGALNLTRVAGERSQEAQVRVDYTEVIVSESVRDRKRAENILIHKADRFNRTIQANEASLEELSSALDEMESQIPGLNEQICDKRGDPCDTFCGGAGCEKCGGLSCNDGLVNTVQLAQKFADGTNELLKRKEAKADELLRGISLAKQSSDGAYDLTLLVLQASLAALNTTAMHKDDAEALLSQVDAYFNSDAAKPSEIRQVALEIMMLNIKLRPEQITELAGKISFTIQSLTDIDAIIDATRKNLNYANSLKDDADRAKMRAEGTLDVAEKVVEALEESGKAQLTAELAISEATKDIVTIEGYLMQIASETTSAQEKANASLQDVQALDQRTDTVQSQFKINENLLSDTKMALNQASLKATHAANEVTDLEDKYIRIEEQLAMKSSAAESARERADQLKRRANKLSSEAYAKLDILKDLKNVFERNEETLNTYELDISSLEIRMEEYHGYILHKAIFYTTCTANTQ